MDGTIRKACQFCRKRKVRCDRGQPSCSLCRSQQHECTYQEDARYTARPHRDKSQNSNNHVYSRRRSSADSRDTSSPAIRFKRQRARANQAKDSQNESPLVQASSRANSDHVAGFMSIVSGENYLTMHGPTSPFRNLMMQPKRPTDALPESEEILRRMRLELFATAALERQKEFSYMLDVKFELDGLDANSAFELLEYYWKYPNNIYLSAYRPAVMHSLATGGIYANKLLLNALYYSAALMSDDPRFMAEPGKPDTLGGRFFDRFQVLLPSSLEVSHVSTISALIVMSTAVLFRGKQTLAFHLSGLAQRMIVDLGFHVNPHKVGHTTYSSKLSVYSMTPTDLELQRRIFWSAYMQDRFQSLYFGRAPSLRLLEGCEPHKTALDTFDELELWSPMPGHTCPTSGPDAYVAQPSKCITMRDRLLELAEITTSIVDAMYTPKEDLLSPDFSASVVDSLRQRLDQWGELYRWDLSFLDGETPVPPPHHFYPLTTHHTLHILLYKPFLPGGHLSSLRPVPDNAEETCIASALSIYYLARSYRSTFGLRYTPFIFIYALFCAATVIPIDSTRISEYINVIQFFWSTLRELHTSNVTGLKRPMAAITSRFERANLDLDALGANEGEEDMDQSRQSVTTDPSHATSNTIGQSWYQKSGNNHNDTVSSDHVQEYQSEIDEHGFLDFQVDCFDPLFGLFSGT